MDISVTNFTLFVVNAVGGDIKIYATTDRAFGQLCHTDTRHTNYANFRQQDGRSAVPY